MKDTAISQMFKAFSDPTRLRIMHLLLDGEWCVGDLVELLEVPQPTASRHLRSLRDAEMVTVRRAGKWSFYRLTPATSGFHKRLLECLSSCFGEVPELRNDAKNARSLRKSGGCCASTSRS